MDVCISILSSAMPTRQVMYPNPYCTCFTATGDWLDYNGEMAMHCPSMTTITYHWNFVLSGESAGYCTADAHKSCTWKAHYHRQSTYNTNFWHMKIPHCIQLVYKLNILVDCQGYICARINKKAWCGLKESSYIVHVDLEQIQSYLGQNWSLDGNFQFPPPLQLYTFFALFTFSTGGKMGMQ